MHVMARRTEPTLILIVFVTTPLFVLILTFRLTVMSVGIPKVKSWANAPRARTVLVNPLPGSQTQSRR